MAWGSLLKGIAPYAIGGAAGLAGAGIGNFLRNRENDRRSESWDDEDRFPVTDDRAVAEERYPDYPVEPDRQGNAPDSQEIVDWYDVVQHDLEKHTPSKGEHFSRPHEDALIRASERAYAQLKPSSPYLPEPHWDRKDDKIRVSHFPGSGENPNAAATYHQPHERSGRREKWAEFADAQSAWDPTERRHPKALGFLDAVSPNRGWDDLDRSPHAPDFPAEIRSYEGWGEKQPGLLPHEYAHHITSPHERPGGRRDPRRVKWMDEGLKERILATNPGDYDHASKSYEIFSDLAPIKRQYFHDEMPRLYKHLVDIYHNDGPEAYEAELDEAEETGWGDHRRSLNDYIEFLKTKDQDWQPTDYQVDRMLEKWINSSGKDARGIREALEHGGSEDSIQELDDHHPRSLQRLRELMRISKTGTEGPAGMFTGKGMFS